MLTFEEKNGLRKVAGLPLHEASNRDRWFKSQGKTTSGGVAPTRQHYKQVIMDDWKKNYPDLDWETYSEFYDNANPTTGKIFKDVLDAAVSDDDGWEEYNEIWEELDGENR